MIQFKSDEAFANILVAASAPDFDDYLVELFERLELTAKQVPAAVAFMRKALQSDTPSDLVDRKQLIVGAWERLETKGYVSIGLKSNLLRYEFHKTFTYWHGQSHFSAYVAPPSVPTAGSSYTSFPRRSGIEGLYITGQALADGRFEVMLCPSNAETVQTLNVNRVNRQLSINGRLYKPGGIRTW